MKKWEYLLLDTPPVEQLNSLGEEGWELVVAFPYPKAGSALIGERKSLVIYALMKREKVVEDKK